MPLGDVGVSVVDVRDIAEAAAIVLTSGEPSGKTYNLNGPEVVSGAKAASIWGEVLGKRIQMGICLTQVGPTGCGFGCHHSASGWRIWPSGTGSVATACWARR